jgi:hypothetical protein
MFRARVVFNGPVEHEYPFYSIPKQTEREIRDMLDLMKPVLTHAVSVQLQESQVEDFPGARPVSWHIVPAFNDDWTQRK